MEQNNADALRAAIELLKTGIESNWERARGILVYLVANDPTPEAFVNLGVLYERVGNQEAESLYRHALSLDPQNVDAMVNLGGILLARQDIPGAVTAFTSAVKLRPGDPNGQRGLAYALLDQGDTIDALGAFGARLFGRGDPSLWSEFLFYSLHAERADSFADSYREAYASWMRNRFPAEKYPLPPRTFGHRINPDTKELDGLRIGYVSPHFKTHTNAAFLLPVVGGHSNEVSVFYYSDTEGEDEITEVFRETTDPDYWRDVRGASNESLDKIIRADGIDVLVDLCGHMDCGVRQELFWRRPAPVLVNYIGYPDDTGVPEMRRVTDGWIDPRSKIEPANVIRIPDGPAFAYTPFKDHPGVTLPPKDANGFVTFGCVQRVCKITPTMIDVWGRVLTRVTNSRMRFLCPGGERNTGFVEKISNAFLNWRIDVAGRVDFVPTGSRAEYFDFVNSLDVALDTYPYSGHTTVCDCMMQGVPTVSMYGRVPRSRIATTLSPWFAVPSADLYVQEALLLAGATQWRYELRRRLIGDGTKGERIAAYLEDEFARLARVDGSGPSNAR